MQGTQAGSHTDTSDRLGNSPDVESHNTRRGLAFILAVIILAQCWYFHSWRIYRNVNEYSRLYLVRALIESGTPAIDQQIKQFGYIQDKATFGGRSFTDKPIGLSVMAAPV